MPRRSLKINDLRRILSSFGIEVDRIRGSHYIFAKRFPEGRFTFPIPVHGKDVLDSYVVACRRRFRLTEAEGVSDDEFFSR